MTYQNELDTNRRSDIIDDTRYGGWIIGGVVTLAIVIAAVAFTSTGNYPDRLQTITTSSGFCSVACNDWLRYGTPSSGQPLNRSRFPAMTPWMRERGNASGPLVIWLTVY